MIKAVVDANVLISSVIAPLGPSRRIFNSWRDGTFVLVTSPGILEEVTRRLAHLSGTGRGVASPSLF